MRPPAPLPPLYAIVDPLDTGRDPIALARAMLDGGARLLQLRVKRAAPRELHIIAQAVRDLARGTGATVLVNDRPDVAATAGVDGVHLGQDDVPPAVAASILPASAWIGLSTHDAEQVEAAHAVGPSYVAVGPVYATESKDDALSPRGLALVREARRRTDRPLVAIGGITAGTAVAVRDAGADSVAMIGAIVKSPDVTATVRDLLAALGAGS